MSGWKKVISQVAPALAQALGGPLAGLAVKEIGQKWLGKENATEDDLAAAVVAADPAKLLELRKLDQEFNAKLVAAGVELEKLAMEDRGSARAREIALKDATPKILAGVVLATFGVTHFYLLGHVVPDGSRDLVARALGSLDAIVMTVIAYYFGSSAGSKAKNDLIEKATK